MPEAPTTNAERLLLLRIWAEVLESEIISRYNQLPLTVFRPCSRDPAGVARDTLRGYCAMRT